jgi:hypothetical protein
MQDERYTLVYVKTVFVNDVQVSVNFVPKVMVVLLNNFKVSPAE